MANVAIAFTPTLHPFPFQIPEGEAQPWTAIPRQRITALVAGGVVTAKIATNTTSIAVNAVFPQNFAYTVEHVTVSIITATNTSDADNFDDIGVMTFVQNAPLPAGSFSRVNLVAPGFFGAGANAGSGKAWEPVNPYGGPLFNLTQDPVLVNLELNDNDAGATVVGSLTAVIQVLQYDIDQVFNYPLNYATPVTSRGL